MDKGNSSGEKSKRISPDEDMIENDHNKRRKGCNCNCHCKKREETMDDGFGTSNKSNAEGDEEYFATMPPGNKFDPNDHQILMDYLMPRIKGQPLPRNKIREVNLYKYNPEDLTALYNKREDKAWFFLTSRDRKYANGNRPDRAAGINKPGEGYWKATGSVHTVYDKGGNEVGKRNALVFYRGKPKKETKTDWLMHEFIANYDNCNSDPVKDTYADKMRMDTDEIQLDDWVLCKIHRNSRPCTAIDNRVKKDESAPPATNKNDSSVMLESNIQADELFLETFQNLSPIGSLSPGTLSGFHSGYDVHQNLMTTNVDNQYSNHHLHLDAAPQYSMDPLLSSIAPTSLSPGNDFWYNQNSFMAHSDDSAGWHWENIDPNIFDTLTPMVPTPLIIRENPHINDGEGPPINNGEGHSSSAQEWTHTDKVKRPLIENNGEDPSSSKLGWRHTEHENRPYIYNNGECPGSSMQGWTHSEGANRPYIYNNGEGPSSSGQGWTHSEGANRPYIYNNGEDPSSSGQIWTHSEDANRPYIVNNGGGHSIFGQGWASSDDGNMPCLDNNGGGDSSSGQGWTHSEDGNRRYIHNNGEGSSGQHTEDGNRPYYIDNNGGGHRSSGQGQTHTEDGNRPYHIHNNVEGGSRKGRRPPTFLLFNDTQFCISCLHNLQEHPE